MRYVLGRILQSALLLLGVSLLSFAFLEIAPGDFFEEVRLNPQISQETVAKLRTQYGLDGSLPSRYWRWLKSAGRGEFGFSFAYGTPAAPLLWMRARNTLLLTSISTLVAWMVAIPLGVFSASRPNGIFSRLTALGTSSLLATPDLLLALLALSAAVRTGWFRVGGMAAVSGGELSSWAHTVDVVHHLVLPASVLVSGSLPVLLRHTTSAMKEALATPFVAAARAHGIAPSRVLFRHALPAALNPLASLFGASVASLLSMSLLVEVVWSWPGLGPLLLEATMDRDIYVVIGAVMLSTLLLVIGMLVGDVLLCAVDPRIRAERLA